LAPFVFHQGIRNGLKYGMSLFIAKSLCVTMCMFRRDLCILFVSHSESGYRLARQQNCAGEQTLLTSEVSWDTISPFCRKTKKRRMQCAEPYFVASMRDGKYHESAETSLKVSKIRQRTSITAIIGLSTAQNQMNGTGSFLSHSSSRQ
jgi:hypothetical protein